MLNIWLQITLVNFLFEAAMYWLGYDADFWLPFYVSIWVGAALMFAHWDRPPTTINEKGRGE